MPDTFEKDPDSKTDYEFDWTRWLNGDSITESTMLCSTPEVIESDGHTATKATVWVQGGVVWSQYKITNRIVTAAGRIKDKTITVAIKPK